MGANSKKQKYIIECLLSSKDIFSRCISIIQAHYFDKDYERVIKFVVDYYSEHGGMPKKRVIDAEFDIQFKKLKITRDEVSYVCDEIEKFCKEAAVKEAVLASTEDIKNENYGSMLQRITDAVSITLDRDMGIEFFDNPEEKLKSFEDHQTYESTGIDAIDKHLGGGILRKELTLFSANSGGGKSIMMNNIGATFAHRGMRVLYISLELPEDKIYLRTSAIWSNTNAKEWMSNIPKIAARINQGKKNGGSFVFKRMPQQSSANDIRAYLKQYEIENDCVPDMLIVDYLDLMAPNCGGKGMNVSDRDKYSTEQLTEILHDFDMYGLSASQQNRDGIGNSSPDQSIIAGGLTKINTTDNYISIYMDAAMRLVGKMMIYFLKTRSSDGVGNSEEIAFNTQTLAITDVGKAAPFSVMPLPKSKRGTGEMVIPDMPTGEGGEQVESTELEDIVDAINEEEKQKKFDINDLSKSGEMNTKIKENKDNNKSCDLISLMKSIN